MPTLNDSVSTPSGRPADPTVDLLVVGGGINGAGIARDAAGRGLKVLLVERDDLASHTSSASTKLIHGGLRYLEHYQFGLVRKALIEREVLLRSAPHIMRPLRFVMPHDPAMRPAWMIRAGIFLYDHLARREMLPGSETVRLARHRAGDALRANYVRGFVYSDGWVDDARLVVLAALDAAERGAQVLTRTRCLQACRGAQHWSATLRSEADGSERTVQARALVNAAGPWAHSFLTEGARLPSQKSLRLIKGSHIIVPRLFDHGMAYIFQGADRRIVFAIPYEQNFTLVGTTDVEHVGDPGQVAISADETDYLCQLANRYFKRTIRPADVLASYSGVRPLLEDASDDPSKITRDYALELNGEGAPLLSVWGGKITTFRKLAEQAVDQLAPLLGNSRPGWTGTAVLPGGDLAQAVGMDMRADLAFDAFWGQMRQRYAKLPASLVQRYARAYGTRMTTMLGTARTLADLGEPIAGGVYERELTYLRDVEWARTGADVLRRRSKLYLHLSAAQAERVGSWMARGTIPAAEPVS